MKKKTSTDDARQKAQTWDEIGKAIGAKIEKECKDGSCKPWKIKEHVHEHKCGGAFYGLGFVGAAVYFIMTSTGFWMGVLGVLKAIVWPAFIVYGALKFLGM